MTEPQWDAAQMQKDKADLQDEVTTFSHRFVSLENELAKLLHNVLFFRDVYENTRVAYAIYFSPDGFGGRMALVNNAITEWLVENAIGSHDFTPLWNRIHGRLDKLRRIRNSIAHGRVDNLIFEKRGAEEMEARSVPPTYDHRFYRTVDKGNRPGQNRADMKKWNAALHHLQMAVMSMAQAVEDFDAEEPTWQARYRELERHLAQLDGLFPAAQKPQECLARPQPPAE